MIRTLIVIPLLFVLSCSHGPAKAPVGTRKFLFPHGTYQHDVSVQLTKAPANGPKEFDFKGVFEFREDYLRLIALSPLGTTMFRVEENLKTHDVQMEIFVESLKKYEDRIKPLYVVTRDVLTLPVQEYESKGIQIFARNEKNLPLKIVVPTAHSPVAADLSGYDRLDIPRKLFIQAPEFRLSVEVDDYEF